MAKQSSRDLVLERRKALSQGGKKAAGANTSAPNRVRSATDARTTRTDESFVKASRKSPRSASTHNSQSEASLSSYSSKPSTPRRQLKAVSHPSRELVLSRREALSRRGKSADTSKDRTRGDVSNNSSPAATTSTPESTSKACCKPCEEQSIIDSKSFNSLVINERSSSISSRNGDRRQKTKRKPIENSSRTLVLARRDALSKHGKSAIKMPPTTASLARQGDPDLTSREISQRVRELRSKSGATGKQRSGTTRPCGPNRNGSKLVVAADAHWKVGSSQTDSGQLVTGTQANRSIKTTGNEASTCRSITGTQYLGADTFETFCQSSPSYVQPSKVGVTSTSNGNRVTGNEVGRSEKVTGDEPGTCKKLTGTEYISANQSNAYCGEVQSSPRKVGQSLTQEGRKVSGVIVGRSAKVTGDEAGVNRSLTGDQYLGSDPLPEGRPAEKVDSFNTLRGSDITGTNVSRGDLVTGNEPGSCKRVTGDEYLGTQHYQSFCGGKPEPEAAKVGFSVTNKSQVVSGTRTGRSGLVTGDEPGTCKAVTGTPYAGLGEAGQWCNDLSVNEIRQRTPKRIGTPGARLTGQQPGIGGVMTGAKKGACEELTGTPYVGSDQLEQACGKPISSESDVSQGASESAPWTQFSVQSPARASQVAREQDLGVTGSSYEQGSRITGPFDMADNKVTGTEQFRFDRKPNRQSSPPALEETLTTQEGERPPSRITGEGQSAGLNITGDDWERGERVTGTEGVSARRRNPSRSGSMNGMNSKKGKRNEEVAEPNFLITGASGNTRDGQLVTFSGGARG